MSTKEITHVGITKIEYDTDRKIYFAKLPSGSLVKGKNYESVKAFVVAGAYGHRQ